MFQIRFSARTERTERCRFTPLLIAVGFGLGNLPAVSEEDPATPLDETIPPSTVVVDPAAPDPAEEAEPLEGEDPPVDLEEPAGLAEDLLLPPLEVEELPTLPYDEDLEGSGLLPELSEEEAKELEELFAEEETGDAAEFPAFGGSAASIGRVDEDVRSQELLPGGFAAPLLREGFRFGLGVQANYDSNVRQAEFAEQAEYFFTFSPSAEYRSAPDAGVPGVFTASYEPNIRIYPDDSSLDTVDHSAAASVRYTGVRGQVIGTVDYGLYTAGNQSIVGLAESEFFRASMQGAYQVSEKINLTADWIHELNEVDQEFGPSLENETSSLRITTQYALSPELWVGPSIRHAVSDSDTLGETETVGYTLAAGYKPGALDKFYLKGEVGVETVDRKLFGTDSTNFTGSVQVDYNPNERFSFGGELSYQAVPNAIGFGLGSGGGGSQTLTGGLRARYWPQESWEVQGSLRMSSTASEAAIGESTDTSFVSLSVRKEFSRGSATLGARLRNNSYEVEGLGATPREDDTALSAFLRYSRPIFSDDATFTSSVQWTDNSGNRDWSRFQFSSGVIFSF